MEVQERWWHRLTKAGLVLGVSAVGLFAVVAAGSTWYQYEQSHSWESGWDPSKPSELCKIDIDHVIPTAGVSCSGIYTPDALYSELVKAGVLRESADFRAESDYRQGLALEKFLRENPQRHRSGQEFSPKAVAQSLGIALLVTLVCAALAFGAWRLLLYVAHGAGAKLTK